MLHATIQFKFLHLAALALAASVDDENDEEEEEEEDMEEDVCAASPSGAT